jgi:hypothetical protein
MNLIPLRRALAAARSHLCNAIRRATSVGRAEMLFIEHGGDHGKTGRR